MKRTRNYKADLEELEGEYQEARDKEFNDAFRDFLCDEEYIMNRDIITEDDIQGFLDSFTFPDVADWCASEYQSRLESFEDAKYEAEKERKMGL